MENIKKIAEESYYIFRQLYLAIVLNFYINIPNYLLGEKFNNLNILNQLGISTILAILFAIFICRPFSAKNKYFLKNEGIFQLFASHIILRILRILRLIYKVVV